MSRLLLLLLPLAGCGDYPRDVEGTLKRVQTERRFTVAFARTGGEADAHGEALIAQVGRAIGAEPHRVDAGVGEAPLLAVESGEIDLLVVPIDPNSPWAKRVTVGPQLAEPSEVLKQARLVPITRNGENAWVDRVHRAAEAARQTS